LEVETIRQVLTEKIDTIKAVEVPEGITLSLPVAGYVSRSLAFIIDILIRTAIIWFVSIIFSFLGNFGTGFILLSAFLVEWFYPVFFEVLNYGQTPGKKSLGLVVVNDDGTPIGWSSSIVRNLLRIADFLPFFYTFGILSMLYSHDFKRLGDYAAGTLVIHKLQRDKKLNINEQSELGVLSPKTALKLDEQSGILSFSERAQTMSDARVNELANYLEPWIDKEIIYTSRRSPAFALFRMANWIRGQR